MLFSNCFEKANNLRTKSVIKLSNYFVESSSYRIQQWFIGKLFKPSFEKIERNGKMKLKNDASGPEFPVLETYYHHPKNTPSKVTPCAWEPWVQGCAFPGQLNCKETEATSESLAMPHSIKKISSLKYLSTPAQGHWRHPLLTIPQITKWHHLFLMLQVALVCLLWQQV